MLYEYTFAIIIIILITTDQSKIIIKWNRNYWTRNKYDQTSPTTTAPQSTRHSYHGTVHCTSARIWFAHFNPIVFYGCALAEQWHTEHSVQWVIAQHTTTRRRHQTDEFYCRNCKIEQRQSKRAGKKMYAYVCEGWCVVCVHERSEATPKSSGLIMNLLTNDFLEY